MCKMFVLISMFGECNDLPLYAILGNRDIKKYNDIVVKKVQVTMILCLLSLKLFL